MRLAPFAKRGQCYDQWLQDARVGFHPDPRKIDAADRDAMKPLANEQATKLVGDRWLFAFAETSDARLVTFDKGLHAQAHKIGNRAVIPA
jgi:hypothetical protein